VFLLIYHNTTHGSCKEEYQEEITVIKTYISVASSVLMLFFGIAQFAVTGIREMTDWWQLLCVIEVFAVLLLGSLDLIDVYAYGAQIGIE